MVRGMKYPPAIVLFSILILAGCAKQSPDLATVGDTTITLDDLKSKLAPAGTEVPSANVGYDVAASRLDNMIEEELIYQACLEEGFDKRPEIAAELKRRYEPMLRNMLYEKLIADKIVKESEIRNFYNNMQKYVLCRNIFIKFPEMANEQQVDSVRIRAQSVYRMLKNGADFAEMAAIYSNDKLSSGRGGVIGRLTYARSDDPLLNAAFTLKEGEISKPVKNRMGYHILKADEIIVNNDVPSYEEARRTIVTDLLRSKRKELDQAAREYQDSILEKYHLTYNDSLIQTVAEIMGSAGQTPGIILERMRALSADTLDMPLATLSFKDFTVSEFMEKIAEFSPYGRMTVTNGDQLKLYLNNWILTLTLLKNARDNGIDKDKEFLKRYTQAKRAYLVSEYTNDEIIGDIDASEEAVRAFYEAQKDSLYSIPETRTVREIYSKDQARINELRKKIMNGASFAAVAGEYTERPDYKKRQGLLGDIREKSWGEIGVQAFQMKKGMISEPITPAGGSGYSLITVENITPAHWLDFNESRAKILQDMKDSITRDRKGSWLRERRNAVPVRINEETLEELFPKTPKQ
ncbi:peptidylprolyl isomerase [bacterium]|nr:peptidylprolyl isomerase [bacterium]